MNAVDESRSAPAKPAKAAPKPPSPYLVPAFITCILIGAHLTFGILESYSRTAVAIGVSILIELAAAVVATGVWVTGMALT